LPPNVEIRPVVNVEFSVLAISRPSPMLTQNVIVGLEVGVKLVLGNIIWIPRLDGELWLKRSDDVSIATVPVLPVLLVSVSVLIQRSCPILAVEEK
jgi:hypothetical protein